ncbi:MAG: alpha/beta hydrolase, partial [Mycobacterium sp.]|nr:alpha/beta hydrolase [Mycobacterium sp.]
MSVPVRILVLAALVVVGLVGSTAPAAATVPAWSGLDARDFGEAIPAPGAVVEAVELDPALSVVGAGEA